MNPQRRAKITWHEKGESPVAGRLLWAHVLDGDNLWSAAINMLTEEDAVVSFLAPEAPHDLLSTLPIEIGKYKGLRGTVTVF